MTKFNFLKSRQMVALTIVAVIILAGALAAPAQDEESYRKALSEAYLKADPSEYRGKAFRDYCSSLYNAKKTWAEAKPFIEARFNELMGIDFYGALLGIVTNHSLFSYSSESLSLLTSLPPDQKAAIKIISGWMVDNSPVNKTVPPNIPYPSGVPQPGYGWGKTVSSNQAPGTSATVAEFEKSFAKANEALANVARYDGQVKYELKDYAGAIADFTRAIKLSPTNFHLLNERAAAYLRSNNYELAQADLTQSLILNPGADNKNVRDLLANVNNYIAKGKDIEVLKKQVAGVKALEPLKNKEAAIKLQILGDEQKQQKHFDAAISSYSECLRLVPDRSQCLMGRGNAYTQKMSVLNPSPGDAKMMELALADYAAAIRKADDILGLAYYNRGVLYRKVQKYPEAIADYKLALATSKLTEAQAQTAKKVLSDDEKLYAVQLVNLSVAALERAAASEKAGDAAGAAKHMNDMIQLLTRAIDLDKMNANYYLRRGVAYKVLNNKAAAIADFRTGLKLDPASASLAQQLKSLGVEP